MKVLFVFFVPSGGVETLNRQRCEALRNYGIHASCLYYSWGSGLQNAADFPIYITNEDDEIKKILDEGQYNVVVVITDHHTFPRFRNLGYNGKFILEIQGFGSREMAQSQLTEALPFVNQYASGLLHPPTPYIEEIFQTIYPHVPRFYFPNCFNSETFKYQEQPKPDHPIIAWLGRMEDNKNWREFLNIGYQLSYYIPNLEMWMFEDKNLSIPSEREKFMQVISQLRLEDNLVLHSNVPNVQMQYYYSSIGDSGGLMCSTSKVEGGPLSVLEAMSCRCPVLATHSDGVAVSIRHNDTGKNYNLGDVPGAVTEALELMQDTVLRERIRDNAQALLLTEFNTDVYCRNFIHMLYNI
ncbi:glycosyltransferase family 4 protein [Paenibacillus pini]|uniref:Glycosyl transferase family 1 domain-containing protein n=1 Tax=Paenibacillus pini JCM 16418 TaxID=1236976 RepID=W7Z2N5_9BACL|nr:glycosyltransferase [Paenibacillus pini]GAF08694.1 hypothetical protein JCM16418_2783 [Paenibacillus pini JCM 16418]